MSFTLIDVANNVLLNCGERPVTTLNTTLGSLVKNSIRSALVDTCTLSDWLWLRDETLAESWSSDVATLPSNVQRIRGCAWDSTQGVFHIPYVSESEYVKILPYGYDGTTTKGRAEVWTMIDHVHCRVSPYPTSPTEQAKIKFYVVKWAAMPSTDLSTFDDIPDQYIELVISRASYLFGVNRTGDPAKFAQHQSQYEIRAQQLRTRNAGAPTSGGSMYKAYRNVPGMRFA